MTGQGPARSWPRAFGGLTVAATVVGLAALAIGLVALIRSDGSSAAVVVLAAALLVGSLLVLAAQHRSGSNAALLVIAAIWTSVLLLAPIFVGGRAAPCPELGPIGPAGRDDAAIALMCQQREAALHPPDPIAANAPLSWVFIWGAGIAVAGGGIAVAARRHRD